MTSDRLERKQEAMRRRWAGELIEVRRERKNTWSLLQLTLACDIAGRLTINPRLKEALGEIEALLSLVHGKEQTNGD